jgi:hypothetical protein
MRSSVLWLLASLTLSGSASVNAVEPARPTAPKPATAEAEDNSGPKRPSFFSRIFGGRPREGEPAPAQPSPATDKKPASAPAQKQEGTPEGKPESKPFTKKATPKEKSAEPTKTEEERFEAARQTATDDPKISDLRKKAEASPNNAESNRLMRAYLRSLYGKMRTLEPSLAERIDLTEKAALKLVPGNE